MESPLRPCLACGYNLEGLGDEPRCPECGLLNIPEGYRRQLWELVDSGKWFFSSFFGVFRKRPPGWWWALDRPGDVKHAARRAILYTLAALIIVLGVGAVAGAMVHTLRATVVYSFPNRQDQTTTHHVYEYEMSLRLAMEPVESFETRSEQIKGGPAPRSKQIASKAVQFTWGFLYPCLFLFGSIVLLWAFPACVGIWTQIRKSLPSFARAPRTILAASLLESHRLVYAAAFTAILLSLDAIFRWNGYASKPGVVQEMWYAIPLLVFAFGAMGWIGPLRSDYTGQVIRSRGHAVRIFIMYAFVFPVVTVYAITALFYSLEALHG